MVPTRALLLVALAAIGCLDRGGDGSSSEGTSLGGAAGGPPAETVEIFSWWTSGGEEDALDAVIGRFEAEHPGVTVINAAEEYAEKARETLRARVALGSPPDTFQANIGADLLRWVGDTDVETALEPLDALAEEEGWMSAFPEALLDGASKGGHLYGVPMNVHRINSLFFDRRLFERHHLTPPTTIEELNALVQSIAEDPAIQAEHEDGVVPLALGNQWNWTLSQLTFECILPAIAGPDYYEDFWAGRAEPTDPEITEVLAEILFLRCGPRPEVVCAGYFNADTDSIDWAPGVKLLAEGRAAMAPMGDWAKGYLEGEGLVADEDFGVVPFPGTAGTFVFTTDTFPLPKGAPNRAGAIALLRSFATADDQVAFNAIKGSIPARSDVDLGDFPDAFDSMHRATAAAFQRDRLAMALSGLLPSGTLQNLSSELKAAMQAGSVEIIQNYLVANYVALK